MANQTHAALLTDKEVAQCINQSRTSLFDRSGTTSFRIARAIEQAVLAKLQPAQEFDRARETSRRQSAVELLLAIGWTWRNGAWREPAQVGELPDDREAFEKEMGEKFLNEVSANAFARFDMPNGIYVFYEIQRAWDAWQARAALAARKPLSAVVLGESMSATFPGSNESSDGWFHQPDDPLQLAASLRRIAKEREQEFNSTFYFGYVADMLETCPHCHGSGLDEETFEACTKCNGTGKRDGLEVKT